MRVEAVTVCVDYADFLAETLPSVMSQVDDMVVVTTPEDERTRELCRRLGVRCLPTHCFYYDGAVFNKARGINYGLANLGLEDWVLHVDADIVLPSNSRNILSRTSLERSKLFGCDRVNCVGREVWDRFKASGAIQFEWSCMVHAPRDMQLGARISHFEYGGYCPIGFFQLWNAKGSGIDRYPVSCQGTAEHTDVLHAMQWDRRDRVLIPELLAIHLETKADRSPKMGANWAGRTTPEFSRAENCYVRSGRPDSRSRSEGSARRFPSY